MKLIKIIIAFSLLIPLCLSADSYIKVTNTKSKQTLTKIKSKMKSMGLKPVHKTSQTHYTIYSGPYKDSQRVSRDMNKIKKYFPAAKIITTNTQNTKTTVKDTKLTKKKYNYHVGVSVGYSIASSTENGDKTQISNPPETKGLTYAVDAGYTFDNNIDLSIAYMLANTGDLSYANFYGSLNYRFNNFDGFTPYAGLIVGHSTLTWDISPTTNPEKPDSTSIIYGLQAGFSYLLTDSMAINFSYVGSSMGHKANILDDNDKTIASIEHSLMHTILLGVELRF